MSATTDTQRACPHCGTPAHALAGSFCGGCGREFASAGATTPAEAGTTQPKAGAGTRAAQSAASSDTQPLASGAQAPRQSPRKAPGTARGTAPRRATQPPPRPYPAAAPAPWPPTAAPVVQQPQERRVSLVLVGVIGALIVLIAAGLAVAVMLAASRGTTPTTETPGVAPGGSTVTVISNAG